MLAGMSFNFTVSGYFYQMKHKITVYTKLGRWGIEKADIAYLQLLSHYEGICPARKVSFLILK
jgi:hypothetical protein